ncbi:MAG: hydroxyacylglutathione hydrolase [Gammaproteobacteria bacterium]|nr:hydroxyacylglutathione hydrolase [Gammaproteobacteria bacterium]
MIEKIHPIPAFTDNYIWLFKDSASNNACVVDPGDAEPVLAYLEENGLNLSHILITHHHPDHTAGVAKLLSRYKATVYGPSDSPFKNTSERLQEGDEIEVYGLKFKIMNIPGHTLDHIAYFCDASSGSPVPTLFCGDTLFAAGCGRIFEGNPAMMYESLQKLAELDPQSRVYCTHEYTLANLAFATAADPENTALQERVIAAKNKRENDIPTLPSSIALELATNPFLRCSEQGLIKSAESRNESTQANAVDVFTTLRQWKDNF